MAPWELLQLYTYGLAIATALLLWAACACSRRRSLANLETSSSKSMLQAMSCSIDKNPTTLNEVNGSFNSCKIKERGDEGLNEDLSSGGVDILTYMHKSVVENKRIVIVVSPDRKIPAAKKQAEAHVGGKALLVLTTSTEGTAVTVLRPPGSRH
ncbi:hypothetical protein UY3_08614 [Chelonia mydas]|uniref:Uncharacterized protein n=1 Tax=Chelonia mydas TaxID=8469 RepID=M7C1G8_CHEMY|nr:hypothetical protein UY3_08614 [Chelonia mydas]